jgi:hypothetical protein
MGPYGLILVPAPAPNWNSVLYAFVVDEGWNVVNTLVCRRKEEGGGREARGEERGEERRGRGRGIPKPAPRIPFCPLLWWMRTGT